MKFIFRLLITAAIAYGLSLELPGVHIDSFSTAIVFAIALALLNVFIKPLLVLFTLPITLLTLGLFLFVINALMIILAAKFIDGIQIDGFGWALLFSIILSLITAMLNSLMEKKETPVL